MGIGEYGDRAGRWIVVVVSSWVGDMSEISLSYFTLTVAFGSFHWHSLGLGFLLSENLVGRAGDLVGGGRFGVSFGGRWENLALALFFCPCPLKNNMLVIFLQNKYK